jgi:hypothetical protein
MLLCLAIGLDPLWNGPIVGLFGWLGVKLRANTDKKVAAAKAQEEDRP